VGVIIGPDGKIKEWHQRVDARAWPASVIGTLCPAATRDPRCRPGGGPRLPRCRRCAAGCVRRPPRGSASRWASEIASGSLAPWPTAG
jgi:hypothetical protein